MFESSRAHLAGAGESYGQHMRFALTVAMLTIGAGLACLLHAFVPALCQRTCSRTLGELHRLFADRRRIVEVQRCCEGVLVFVGLLALASLTAAGLLSSGAPVLVTLALALLALGIPVAYLGSNPELEAEPA